MPDIQGKLLRTMHPQPVRGWRLSAYGICRRRMSTQMTEPTKTIYHSGSTAAPRAFVVPASPPFESRFLSLEQSSTHGAGEIFYKHGLFSHLVRVNV
jgi:hypothetical protein